ncbi:hypothetical protein CWN26_26765, partial [Klebsiella pneumoniae]
GRPRPAKYLAGRIAPGRGEKMPEAIGQKSTKMFRFIYRASHKTGRIVNPGAAAHNRSVV